MRVRPRRSEKLSDGTRIGTQLQISMEVYKSPFMHRTKAVVSAAGGSLKPLKYDFRKDKKTGKRVRNLVRFEAPEMKGMTNPVARFQWLNAGDSRSEEGKVLQYEIFDAASSEEGAKIFRKLQEGIASRPANIRTKQPSREETVLSTSDQASAQWYRLDSF